MTVRLGPLVIRVLTSLRGFYWFISFLRIKHVVIGLIIGPVSNLNTNSISSSNSLD